MSLIYLYIQDPSCKLSLTLLNLLVLVYARLVITYTNIIDPCLPLSVIYFSQVNAIRV